MITIVMIMTCVQHEHGGGAARRSLPPGGAAPAARQRRQPRHGARGQAPADHQPRRRALRGGQGQSVRSGSSLLPFFFLLFF